ncbi:MAG: S8 family serine peptidase [Rhodospirillales bacterium]|nr:S8 family serine peptidase [Rhodospirillales bacterium]
MTAWTRAIGNCSAEVRVGVIDTSVDVSHPSLEGSRITLKTVRSPDRAASDANHGTAVVSLLAGTGKLDIVGLAPNALVFSADAFHKAADDVSADAFDLIQGLDWLAQSNVAVINMSLSGPDNTLLKQAISQVLARHIVIVAAAGRSDRSGTQGYPSRYEGVIAVSSVDHRLRPVRSTMRGKHISLAAPGVGLVLAGPQGGTQRVDGTSFAAPFVTAAFALRTRQTTGSVKLMEMLAASARDLGMPGRDPVYGWGLVQYSGLPSC